MNDRQRNTLGVILIAFLALSGCAEAPTPQPTPTAPAPPTSTSPAASGSTATWELREPGSVSAESETIDVAVTRLECANGVTGELLAPVITYESDRVTVRIDAEKLVPEPVTTCIGNEAVPLTVVLSEPIGERALIDGGCDGVSAAPCESNVRASFAP